MEYCKDHSEVMRCLGALENGQQAQVEQAQRIESKIDSGHSLLMTKIDEMKRTEQKKSLLDAVQGTKISLLFWVLTIGTIALISGVANTIFKALGWK